MRSWRLPPCYELRSLLGSGAYGTVAEALDREKGRMCAIKRIPNVFDDLVAARRILREVSILSRLDDPRVVRVYDSVIPGIEATCFNELYLVMEIGDTDLKALMHMDIEFTESHVKWIFYNMLAGLRYLHSAGVYHRDLKPSNVLVNKDCAVKICDFGLAKAVGGHNPVTPANALSRGRGKPDFCNGLGQGTSHSVTARGHASHPGPTESTPRGSSRRAMTKHVATRFYRAPEIILLADDYTEAVDIWSAGCVYAELTQLLAGYRRQDRGPLFPGSTCFPLSPEASRPTDGIYHSRSRREQLNMIFDILGSPTDEEIDQLNRSDARTYIRCFAPRPGLGLRRRLPHISDDSVDILRQMLRFGPLDRVSAEQALGHKLLADIRDVSLETKAKERIVLEFDRKSDHTEQELRQIFADEVHSTLRGGFAVDHKAARAGA